MISANQVEFSFKQYLKEALLQVWRHQTIYLIPVFFFTIVTIFLHAVVPFTAVSNTIGFFLFGWLLFLTMELTFSSTQEKYTPKKYITSIIISMISFKNFLKDYSWPFIMAIGIGFLIWLFIDMAYIATASTTAVEKKGFLEEVIIKTLFDNIPRGFATVLIICMLSNISVTDFFVTTRMMGVTGETPDHELIRSAIINRESWRTIIFYTFGLFFIKPLFIIFAPLAILIFSITITLYSMDIFGVDKMKKIKEMETKKAENFNAVPEMT